MNNLIVIENNEQLISLRKLYDALEIKSKFNDWKNRMFSYGYEENIDYIAVTQKKVTAQGNSSEYIDYYLKIDVAKEVCMIQRNDKGREFRRYFIEVEKAYNDLQFRIGDKKHQLKCMEMLQDFFTRRIKTGKSVIYKSKYCS